MYELFFEKNVKKDFKNINISDRYFIKDTLCDFIKNFDSQYEQNLMQSGKIKKLKGTIEELYRLKLRNYKDIYKKEADKLIILVLSVSTREKAYKNL
jgi:mRNA-degrading endonuclease RelE of RelBE toxin-antitoxin system